jgi:hypothetical protein
LQVDVNNDTQDGHVVLTDSNGVPITVDTNVIRFFHVTGIENDPTEGTPEASGFNDGDVVVYDASSPDPFGGSAVPIAFTGGGGLVPGYQKTYVVRDVDNANGTIKLHALLTNLSITRNNDGNGGANR